MEKSVGQSYIGDLDSILYELICNSRTDKLPTGTDKSTAP